jgi:hypothetical protein
MKDHSQSDRPFARVYISLFGGELIVLQQRELHSFSTQAATSASYRPTKRLSDCSLKDELANCLRAERTNGEGREVNAMNNRFGERVA